METVGPLFDAAIETYLSKECPKVLRLSRESASTTLFFSSFMVTIRFEYSEVKSQFFLRLKCTTNLMCFNVFLVLASADHSEINSDIKAGVTRVGSNYEHESSKRQKKNGKKFKKTCIM